MAEQPVSPTAVYAARPTIQIAAQQYARIHELLLGMRMVEAEGGLSSLELRFSNFTSDPTGGADFAFEDDALLKLGAAVTVYAGDQLNPTEIFRGTITGLEADFPRDGAPELTVLAEDAFQQARMARRTRTYEDLTLADLLRQFAGQFGLTPVIDGLDQDLGTQVQLNESDLAFVRRVLARYDGEMQVVGGELHAAPRGTVQRGRLTLNMNSQLHSARLLVDLAHQVTEVTASGWDAIQGQRISATSTGANAGPGSGTSGAQVMDAALGARSHHLGHLAFATSDELRAAADAAFDDRARRFLTVEGTAEGNPAIRVGTHLELAGLGPRFSNTFYVVRVCHRYDQATGYETDFEAECAYWGGSAG